MTADAMPAGPAIPTRRDLLFGGGMAAAAGLAWWRIPRIRQVAIGPGGLDALGPASVGQWHYQAASGIVLPPPDQLARLLYDQQVARAYQAATDLPVMMVMAYGSSQGGTLQVHRPEICYPASGFALSHTEERPTPTGYGPPLPTRFFTARSDTRMEQVLYWTRIGDALPTSWTGQRLAIMDSNLHGFVPDGLLVRLSVAHQDPDVALDTLGRFVRSLLATVGPRGRKLLVGSAFSTH